MSSQRPPIDLRVRQAGRLRSGGSSLIELLVVLAIILILTGMTVGAYQTMKKSSRVNAATDQVVSMLHLCRNLAISNNAMYFIRIENDDVDPTTHLPVDSNTGIPFPDMIGIYYFTKASDALAATNPGTVWDTIPSQPTDLLQAPHVAVQRVALEQCWYGVNPCQNSPVVLGFNSDGTLAGPLMQLFVTDVPDFRNSADNPTQINNDAKRQTAINAIIYNPGATQSTTHTQDAGGMIKTIRVFSGGLIKREF